MGNDPEDNTPYFWLIPKANEGGEYTRRRQSVLPEINKGYRVTNEKGS